MSTNFLLSQLTSIDGEHLYPFPAGMRAVQRVTIGSRSLNHGTTVVDGKKYIVLIEPVEVSGIKIEVLGR